MKTFKNNSRIADITQNSYGEYIANIGFTECKTIHASGMTVVERKTYKRESTAIKFCQTWVDG